MRIVSFNGGHYLITELFFNKSLEIGYARDPEKHFDLYFHFCPAGHDHAGLSFSVSLFGWLFEFSLRDRRHWNYQLNRWMTDEEAKTEADGRCMSDSIEHRAK